MPCTCNKITCPECGPGMDAHLIPTRKTGDKDMTLNPKEAPKGYRAVLGGSCEAHCAFTMGSRRCLRAVCAGLFRKDKQYVHFVKLPKKPTKPRRKAHVVWVGTAINSLGIVHRFQKRTRWLMRYVLDMYRSEGWQTRGPVKVVLP